MARSEEVRDDLWSPVKPARGIDWKTATAELRQRCWDRTLGRFPDPSVASNPRSRLIYDRPKWAGYEVVLDVWPDVFATGVLLVPKDLNPGERRPVVVCQHGLEGTPADVITQDPADRAYPVYHGFAAALADRGFVVFAPQNFYRGGNRFRQLQRLANPLGKTLFGITAGQHARILEWLSEQAFVDPERIAFYGLSYGGNTAMRVPAVLERYCAVICSGDFNEWIRKSASVRSQYSFPFHQAYEVFEWDLGHTFGHAELAALIAPRPFMVERGHQDGVAPDEWVAHEYARVRRLYTRLGLADRTEIEFFDGPHTIHGEGTYRFLHRHLKWPEP
jgi:hypothetical protein